MRYLNQYVRLRATAVDYFLVVHSSISRERVAVPKVLVRTAGPLCVADGIVILLKDDAIDVVCINRHVEAELELRHTVVVGPWHLCHCLTESTGIILGDVGNHLSAPCCRS